MSGAPQYLVVVPYTVIIKFCMVYLLEKLLEFFQLQPQWWLSGSVQLLASVSWWVSSDLPGMSLALGSGRGCRPGTVDSEKHPSVFLQISKEVGACLGERVDFPLIYFWGFLEAALWDTPDSHEKELAKCLAGRLSLLQTSFSSCSSLPSPFLFIFFTLFSSTKNGVV